MKNSFYYLTIQRSVLLINVSYFKNQVCFFFYFVSKIQYLKRARKKLMVLRATVCLVVNSFNRNTLSGDYYCSLFMYGETKTQISHKDRDTTSKWFQGLKSHALFSVPHHVALYSFSVDMFP